MTLNLPDSTDSLLITTVVKKDTYSKSRLKRVRVYISRSSDLNWSPVLPLKIRLAVQAYTYV